MKVLFCNNNIKRSGANILPHRHNCNEIVLYGKAARGETAIGDETYDFGPLDIAVINKEVLHDEHHFKSTDVVYFGFEASESLPNCVLHGSEEIQKLFYDIVSEYKNQKFGYEKMITLKAEEIITHIQRRLNTGVRERRDLGYCKRYIKENYMHSLKMDELARMTCYSTDRFRHLFTDTFGISPQSYIIELRLEKAKRLIIETELSCTEISRLCGFSDSAQLSRMVKKKYGKAPRELRNKK